MMSRGMMLKRGVARIYSLLNGGVGRHSVGESASVPGTKEIAGYSQDFLAAPLINGVVPNPDEVMMTLAPGKLGQYQKLSTDPYLLHRMMRRSDLKYKSLIKTRKNGVLSKEWRVLPNPNDPDQERAVAVAHFVKATLDGIRNFHESLDGLLDAIPVGFAVSEIMWEQKTVTYGEGQSRVAWVPVDIRQRRQGRFGFADDWSLKYQESAGKFVDVPAGKFIVHTHGRENDSAYGTSEGSEVFWAWYMKHNFIKWWAIFSEKFGMPTAVGVHPANWDDAKKKKLMGLIKAIQTEYGVVIPQGAEIKLLEATRSGSVNTYEKFCEFADKNMSEALTGQSLATGQGQGGAGSYAQSQTHGEVKQEYQEADSKELMATINPQLVRPIVGVNFGAETPVPLFVLDYESKDLTGDLEMDAKLVNDIGLPLPLKYFYEKYGRPMPAEGEEVVRGRAKTPVAQGDDGDEGEETEEETAQRKDAKDAKSAKDKQEDIDGEDPVDDEDEGLEEKETKDKKKKKPAKHLKFGAQQFAVDPDEEREVKRRQREYGRIVKQLAKEGREVFGRLGEAILDEAQAAEDLRDLRERVQGIAAAGTATQELAAAMERAKINGYLIAAAHIKRYTDEVLEAEAEQDENENAQRKDAKNAKRFALLNHLAWEGFAGFRRFAASDILANYDPLPPGEALKWFEALVPLTKGELENLPREAAGSAFSIADFEVRESLSEVQDLISEYLNTGKTKDDFVIDYQAKRVELGLDPAENHHAEQLFRTETGRAYGAGRTKALLNPEVEGAFPLWQYIAVMDDRTRDEHFALNGFVAAPDDTFWLSKNPPWDYNCRCDVIPLSRRQIELRGIVQKPTVTMPDGSEVDPRTWPTSPGFRGLGV